MAGGQALSSASPIEGIAGFSGLSVGEWVLVGGWG